MLACSCLLLATFVQASVQPPNHQELLRPPLQFHSCRSYSPYKQSDLDKAYAILGIEILQTPELPALTLLPALTMPTAHMQLVHLKLL
jgi:hypothetical protein